jgi:hypothetical protein
MIHIKIDFECPCVRISTTATFNTLIDTGELPPSMGDAVITLILKKDPYEHGSYRPISLINCDKTFGYEGESYH